MGPELDKDYRTLYTASCRSVATAIFLEDSQPLPLKCHPFPTFNGTGVLIPQMKFCKAYWDRAYFCSLSVRVGWT